MPLSRYYKLYIEFTKKNLKAMFEYRGDFIIGAASSVIIQFCSIFSVWIILSNINDINGWGFYEIAFLYGMVSISIAINQIFLDSFWNIGNVYIRRGEFDIVLTRPISPLFHLIANRLSEDGFGEFLIGTAILIVSLINIQIALTFVDILLLIVFILSGVAIMAAIILGASSLNFWLTRGNDLLDFVHSAHSFAKYPLTIFPKFIRVILTWILPYAFISFYPATYLLNGGCRIISLLSPLVAIVLWIISYNIWRVGIKNYSSTGS